MTDRTQPYAGFGGKVGRVFATSESWWPPRPTAAEGSPNVIVILCDDVGYSDIGCYGSEIDTPALDALAAEGIRYTNFHVTPMCSPTRASLLTGLNSHMAGVGHVAHSDPGFPGYAMEIADNAATMAEILRDSGYATYMVGKWHLSKDSNLSEAGPKHSWPLQKGFERFYGILDGFTNFHHPHRLVEDNHAVEVDQYPEGYYFTDDITDRAIAMIREGKASNPAKPFFCYFAHGAVHAPLQAKAGDMEKYRGAYEMGWDALREQRYQRMQDMGVLPEGTSLPPRNTEPNNDVKPWDELSDMEKELFARYMEIYAAMVDSVDQSFARLRSELEAMGEWDNTLVLFTSDNGASREGEEAGTSQYFQKLGGDGGIETDHSRLDLLGGPQTLPHYPRGWAMASNTPFRLYKINTHAGGHSVPMIISWPARLPAADHGSLRRQFAHVTDVLPTLLDLLDLDPPTHRNGEPVLPMVGTSFAPTLTDPDAPSDHVEQVYEMLGHRGYYRDGWEVVTLHQPMSKFSEDHWELYDLRSDPTETTDLSAQHPDKVAELRDAWERAAWDNQVFPLEEGTLYKHTIRPPGDEVYERPVTIRPGTPTLERYRCLQLIVLRSVDIDVALAGFEPGDRGVLVSHGDQGGGYVLYVDGDELVFTENEYGTYKTVRGGRIPSGTTSIGVSLDNVPGHTWNVRVRIGSETTGTGEGFACLFPMAPFEGITVGRDPRSPVVWELHEKEGSFPYTGNITHVTYNPGPHSSDGIVAMSATLRELGAAFE